MTVSLFPAGAHCRKKRVFPVRREAGNPASLATGQPSAMMNPYRDADGVLHGYGKGGSMTIVSYREQYRDDMLFMVLQAKDALGKIPRINPDLLDIEGNYLQKGDAFLLALDENGRVIGCGGFSRTEGTDEAVLHRLYVKAALKRTGIGTALLTALEGEMRKRGIAVSKVHLGDKKQYFESWSFYPKHGYREFAPEQMKKTL